MSGDFICWHFHVWMPKFTGTDILGESPFLAAAGNESYAYKTLSQKAASVPVLIAVRLKTSMETGMAIESGSVLWAIKKNVFFILWGPRLSV